MMLYKKKLLYFSHVLSNHLTYNINRHLAQRAFKRVYRQFVDLFLFRTFILKELAAVADAEQLAEYIRV